MVLAPFPLRCAECGDTIHLPVREASAGRTIVELRVHAAGTCPSCGASHDVWITRRTDDG